MADSTNRQSRESPLEEPNDMLDLTLHHHGKPHTFHFLNDATMNDLSTAVAETLSIPVTNQKFMISPKTGLLKPPFPDASLPLHSLTTKKIVLMGSTTSEITAVNSISDQSPRRRNYPVSPARPSSRPRQTQQTRDESIYTFTTLRPLSYLPRPERSLAYLERLRDDPGIKASMRSHQWTVPLLTEMNPVEHTTHESRTLGLNRNRGEAIELRLRTDAYDGYRDYKTIRKTLCHELAHNVFGEHDANFWRLCREIEREVEKADWKSNGRALTSEEFYTPPEEEEEQHMDHGGWTGGDYVLGVGEGSGGQHPQQGHLSRRELLAQAAEERIKRQRERQAEEK
ncbi:MAG: hypothetical protein M1816_003128 [Peltula sp. TS41687]|nr:MAG: hypothetical protein M1816_003128 [Peltula sp. TS41687]